MDLRGVFRPVGLIVFWPSYSRPNCSSYDCQLDVVLCRDKPVHWRAIGVIVDDCHIVIIAQAKQEGHGSDPWPFAQPYRFVVVSVNLSVEDGCSTVLLPPACRTPGTPSHASPRSILRIDCSQNSHAQIRDACAGRDASGSRGYSPAALDNTQSLTRQLCREYFVKLPSRP